MTARREMLATLLASSAWSGVGGVMAARDARAQMDPARDATQIRQLTIVVPFPPGGTTDAVARLVGNALRGSYATTVVVDNRVGAGGRIGLDYLRGRPADGSVLMHTPAFPIAIFPHIYRRLPYDALSDFVPVALTSRASYGLAIGPGVSSSVTTVREFVAWCRARDTGASFATVMGSSLHFVGAVFARTAGISLEPVPYRGGAPALADVVAGHVPAIVSPLQELTSLMTDARLRILAVTSAGRSRFMPNVPTMAEAGYPDVVVADWSGFIGPAGIPPGIVLRANGFINAYLMSGEGQEAMLRLGTEPETEAVPDFIATVRSSWNAYGGIVATTGFVAED